MPQESQENENADSPVPSTETNGCPLGGNAEQFSDGDRGSRQQVSDLDNPQNEGDGDSRVCGHGDGDNENKPLAIDFQEALKFVDIITSVENDVHIRTFSDRARNGSGRKLLGKINSSFTAVWMEDRQAEGHGIFLVINGGGQTDTEINDYRALFVDGDGIPLPSHWPFHPNMIVQRDPEHWHAYWLLSEGSSKDWWRRGQKHLSLYYNSDPTIVNPSRVMRLPGTWHLKSEPVQYKITNIKSTERDCITNILSFHEIDEEKTATIEKFMAGRKSRGARGIKANDSEENVTKCRSELSRRHPAIEGDGGDDWTYQTACICKDYGLSRNMAFDLMMEWNLTCDPPWLEDDLWDIVNNAYRYGKNDPGCREKVPDIVQEFKKLPFRGPELAINEDWDIEEGKEISWPWPSLNRSLKPVRAGQLIIVAAPQKTGKTIFVQNATRGWINQGLGVLSCNMEMTERQQITMLTQIERGLTQEEVTKEIALKAMSKYSNKLWMLDTSKKIAWKELVALCEAACIKHSLDIVVIDNLHWLCRGENENQEMGEVTKAFKELAKVLKIAVVIIHHPRKGMAGSMNLYRPMNIYELRGSGAITQDADMVIVLFRKFWTDDDDGRILVKGEAMRYAPPSTTWLKFDGVHATIREEF